MTKHWFVLGLTFAVLAGLTGSEWLGPLARQTWLTSGLVFLVMVMMSAPVPLESARQTLARPWPALLASLVNLGVVPLMGWLASRSLPPELAGGLIVAAAVPSTLSSAAVMARKAGGDDTVSIFTTLITNVSCVVVTPLWLFTLLGVTVRLSMVDMILNLSLVVLLPIAIAQVARWRSVRFQRWADTNRNRLSVYCQVGILAMVMLGAVHMARGLPGQSLGAEPVGEQTTISLLPIVWVAVLSLAIHLASLALCNFLASQTGIARPQRIAASFSASQKTLMIGLNLAIYCGVNILPMLAYHVLQLLADAFIAEKWGRGQNSGNNHVPST